MYMPRDLNYEPLYAVATFLSTLQSYDLSEPERKIARDYLKRCRSSRTTWVRKPCRPMTTSGVWRTMRRSRFRGPVA